jgi:hypothetical protein
MGTDESLSAGESTPPMSGTEETPVADAAATKQFVTKEDLSEMLGTFEQRIKQSTSDTVKSTVNKALGVPRGQKPEAQPEAKKPPVEQPVEETPPPTEQPVEEPAASTEETQPLASHLEMLKADGVDIEQDIDPLVLEAYQIQAQHGVHLTGLPEMEMIDPSSRGKYLASVEDAVLAAVARMKEEGTYEQHIDTGESLASAPGLTAGKTVRRPAHAKMSGAETLEHAFNS